MVDIYDIFKYCGKQRNHKVPIYGKYVFLFFQLQQKLHPMHSTEKSVSDYLFWIHEKYSEKIWRISIVETKNIAPKIVLMS